jgi:hypothetical protein
MGHRLSGIAVSPVVGTLFWVLNSVFDGVDFEENGDIWAVPIDDPGGTPGSVGEGNCVKLTDASIGLFGSGDQEFYWYGIPSPNRAKLLGLYATDTLFDRVLVTMNAEGLGEVQTNAGDTARPVWVGDNLLAFLTSGSLVDISTVEPDGSNEQIILTKADGFGGIHGSPDGTKIAFVAKVGTDWQLCTCDPDGSNEDVLVSTGVQANSGPSWTLDGTQIVFAFGSNIDIINADGSGQTTLATSVSGFSDQQGMGPDALYYTDTSTFSNWRLAAIDLGGGGASIIYGDRLVQAVQGGVAIYDAAQDRVFSAKHEEDSVSGTEALFSVAPDGSDPRVHFEATEDNTNPGDNFQSLGFR